MVISEDAYIKWETKCVYLLPHVLVEQEGINRWASHDDPLERPGWILTTKIARTTVPVIFV